MIPWMPYDKPYTFTTWYSVVIIPIKFILLSSMVRLHEVTYVYIPHRFKPPYNANKSIFVYLHGIFNIHVYICCHGYIINNNNLHGFFFICIYIYIYICPPIFYLYVSFSIYLFVFSHDITMSVQVILNAFSIGCHTLHHTTSWMITFCNVFMRFNQSKKFNIFI